MKLNNLIGNLTYSNRREVVAPDRLMLLNVLIEDQQITLALISGEKITFKPETIVKFTEEKRSIVVLGEGPNGDLALGITYHTGKIIAAIYDI